MRSSSLLPYLGKKISNGHIYEISCLTRKTLTLTCMHVYLFLLQLELVKKKNKWQELVELYIIKYVHLYKCLRISYNHEDNFRNFTHDD